MSLHFHILLNEFAHVFSFNFKIIAEEESGSEIEEASDEDGEEEKDSDSDDEAALTKQYQEEIKEDTDDDDGEDDDETDAEKKKLKKEKVSFTTLKTTREITRSNTGEASSRSHLILGCIIVCLKSRTRHFGQWS